jgi:hypothetical protein
MTDNAKKQAFAQMDSIHALVAAMAVDYDRLDELNGTADLIAEDDGPTAYAIWLDSDEGRERAALLAAAGDCMDADEARERILEDALDVQVRSGWNGPDEKLVPSEYMILLCTGGPAVRIRGDLDQYLQPCSAVLEYQDWGTPWTEYRGDNADPDTLLAYAQCFYFA